MYKLSLFMGILGMMWGVVACTPNDGSTGDVATDGALAEGTAESEPEAFVVVTRAFDDLEEAEGALDVPAPGEFVASETEDPDANILFDRIYLVRTGEIDGEAVRDELEILPNGRYTRNGQSGLITPDEIASIQGWIVEANFFGIQGAMLGPTADTADYRYRLTIERNGLERMVQSQDGFMPAVYQSLLGEILLVGLR